MMLLAAALQLKSKLTVVPVRLGRLRLLHQKLPLLFSTHSASPAHQTNSNFSTCADQEPSKGIAGNMSKEGGLHPHSSSPLSCDTSPASCEVTKPVVSPTLAVSHDLHPHSSSPLSCDTSPASCEVTKPMVSPTLAASHETSPVAMDQHGDKFPYFSKGFTSEIFKIRLSNIPGRMGYNNLRRFLSSLELTPVKIKKPFSQSDTAFINFRNEEDRVLALKMLNGKVWKNKTLSAKVANPTPDPLFQRKRSRPEEAAFEAKRAKLQGMTLEERLHDAVTPWLNLPYQEQLQKKEEQLKVILKDMAYRITHKDAHPGEWFEQYISNHNRMVCPLDPIRHSSVLEGYRNKCEFSIGRCQSGDKVVVGFRLGSYEQGDFNVASAATCHHIPERAKELARLFEVFFGQSPLAPFSSKDEQGYWRMVSVRCFQSGETMAIVQLHPQQLTQDEMEVQKSRLVEFFSTGEGAQAPPTSLYFQVQGRLESNVEPSYEHLLGEKHVHENLLGLKFRISPASFFQVNTPSAELLYSLIRELAMTETVVERPVIYDICCGTGTIGLYLAKNLARGVCARKVVGVEMVEQAVEDAKVNAEINGVSNVEFVCGKAEDVMPSIDLPWAKRGEIIAIVDPPRGGLHPKVVRTIRESYAIQKLVYVSCNPNGAKQNIVNLCRRKSNRVKGHPFRVVSATPVDMFPHTPHCELVMVLERVKEGDMAKGGTKGVKEELVAKKGEVAKGGIREGVKEGVGRVKGEEAGVERVKETATEESVGEKELVREKEMTGVEEVENEEHREIKETEVIDREELHAESDVRTGTLERVVEEELV